MYVYTYQQAQLYTQSNYKHTIIKKTVLVTKKYTYKLQALK